MSTVFPSLSLAFGFAPLPINSFAGSKCLSNPARINAAFPSLSFSFTSAPWANFCLTTSISPLPAAVMWATGVLVLVAPFAINSGKTEG